MAGKSINLFASKGKKKKTEAGVKRGTSSRSYASRGASKSYTRPKAKGRPTKGRGVVARPPSRGSKRP